MGKQNKQRKFVYDQWLSRWKLWQCLLRECEGFRLGRRVLPAVFVLWFLVGSDIIHSVSSDDTDVDVVPWTEVAHDSCVDGESHQLRRSFHLDNQAVTTATTDKLLFGAELNLWVGIYHYFISWSVLDQVCHSGTSMSCLNPSSRIPRAARSPDPSWAQSKLWLNTSTNEFNT